MSYGTLEIRPDNAPAVGTGAAEGTRLKAQGSNPEQRGFIDSYKAPLAAVPIGGIRGNTEITIKDAAMDDAEWRTIVAAINTVAKTHNIRLTLDNCALDDEKINILQTLSRAADSKFENYTLKNHTIENVSQARSLTKLAQTATLIYDESVVMSARKEYCCCGTTPFRLLSEHTGVKTAAEFREAML